MQSSDVISNYRAIIYSDDRFDVTSHLLPVIQWGINQKFNLSGNLYHNDTLLVLKCLLTKSKDWSHEKEWRVFIDRQSDNFSPFGKICNLKPKALYIGSKTEKKYKRKAASKLHTKKKFLVIKWC